jgi:hypothetical protein
VKLLNLFVQEVRIATASLPCNFELALSTESGEGQGLWLSGCPWCAHPLKGPPTTHHGERPQRKGAEWTIPTLTPRLSR